MNFLNKTKSEARWLTPVLGVVFALTSVLLNYNTLIELMRSMDVFMGMDMNVGYVVLMFLASAIVSTLLYILFLGIAYSIAYRTLVTRTRDVKAMPISKDSLVNHVLFVMSISNVVIGAITFALRLVPLYALVIDVIVRFVVRVISYLLVIHLLSRVGVGDNVKKKLYGSLLTPFAVLIVLLA